MMLVILNMLVIHIGWTWIHVSGEENARYTSQNSEQFRTFGVRLYLAIGQPVRSRGLSYDDCVVSGKLLQVT